MHRLEKFLDRLRLWLLNIWLIMVGVVILLPAGFARRILGNGLPPRKTQRGWQKTLQSTSDKKIFESKF